MLLPWVGRDGQAMPTRLIKEIDAFWSIGQDGVTKPEKSQRAVAEHVADLETEGCSALDDEKVTSAVPVLRKADADCVADFVFFSIHVFAHTVIFCRIV
jgi:hypothetical protein